MTELLRNGWLGWLEYTKAGKLPALFLAAVLFLWLWKPAGKQKKLLKYSTVMGICCIFPVTAAVLMIYQTKFYDYVWIWSFVPVTVILAYAGTEVLFVWWQDFSVDRKKTLQKALPVTIGLGVILLLCSGLGSRSFGGAAQETAVGKDYLLQKQKTEEVLLALQADKAEKSQEAQEICLLAPREIMEVVRSLDAEIQLPYGRDMWEAALGAYSYDAYTEKQESLYLWMCSVQGGELTPAQGVQIPSTEECLDTAKELGVNMVLLPKETEETVLEEVIRYTGKQPEEAGAYYEIQL